jgi:conjugative transposon TraN protein
MKKFCAIWIVLLSLKCFCQSSIEPYPLQVGINKTTNLIFPYQIKSVDRGSRDLLVQKAKGIENVLQVKASAENFVATNLSVITADGKLYSFAVSYTNNPAMLNISFATDSMVHFNDENFNEAWLENEAKKILKQYHFMHIITRNEQMKLLLNGIYISKGVLWFSMQLSNHSLIDYHPDYIKFFIQDKHHAKRTSEQRTELEPIYQIGMPVINGKSKKKMVFAFNQFTLSKGKRLVCQISEKNGGRLLVLHINQRALLHAHSQQLAPGNNL